MSIQYIDGTVQVFEWEAHPEETESANMVSHLQKTLHEDHILLEMGDKLIILIKENIKTIELNTVPARLPQTAIRGVRLVE
jgi:hypothetical protein